MGVIRDIKELSTEAEYKARLFLEKCGQQNFPVAIIETRRELITQLVYFLQGAIDPTKHNKDIVNEYNRLRKKIGLWEVSTYDALNKKVTWTLESNHEEGNAFDAVPLKDGKAWWAAPDDVWNKMGEIGESVGLEWGGRWTGGKQDRPHFQLPPK